MECPYKYVKTDISSSINVYFHTSRTFVILNNSERKLSIDFVNRLTTMIFITVLLPKQ